MSTRLCSVQGCNRCHSSKGFCKAHYMRFYRGLPLAGPIGPEGRAPRTSPKTIPRLDGA